MNAHTQDSELAIVRQYLTKRSTDIERRLREACMQSDRAAANGHLNDLMDVARAQKAASAVAGQVAEEATTPVYMLSTVSIQQVMKELTLTENEDLRFATGIEVAPRQYAITTFCQFALRHTSMVAAEADHTSMTRMLIGLHESDHKLLMTGHSHPGLGPGSTTPSSVDIDFHKRLEEGGYPVIGMIVNRKGYVRFFSHTRPFTVVVHGKGMEIIDEHNCLFKLDSMGPL